VDPADIPASAKLPNASQLDNVAAPAPSQKKRKAAHEATTSSSSQVAGSHMSQPSASQPLRRLPQPAALQEMDEEDGEATAYEEEPRDELYCVLNAKIVGVQYYKGMCHCRLLLLSVYVFPQVWWGLARKSGSSENHKILTIRKRPLPNTVNYSLTEE
jgi:hypothetical protein